jgi:DNA-binding XRE family transcriptional regulator
MAKPLSKVRRGKLISQRDLAAQCGITASTVFLIETHRTEPSLRVMKLICAALEIVPQDVEEFADALESGRNASRDE